MERRSVNSIGMFDAAKGLFVLMMILGHSTEYVNQYWDPNMERTALMMAGYWLSRVCGYGAISMFFIMCGYGFRMRSMAKAAEGQVKYLWKPYVIMALSVAVLAAAKKLVTHGDVLEGLTFQALPYLLGICPAGDYFGLTMDSVGPVWFVVTFVFAGILLNAVLQEERTWAQWMLAGMLASVGVCLKDYRLPFCFQQSLVCTLFMYVGWTMKKRKFLEMEIPKYFIALTLAFLCFAAYFGEVEVSQNRWNNGLVDVFAAIPGGVLLTKLSLELNCFRGKFMQFIRWLGRQALMFCCIHSVFYSIIPWEKVVDYFGGNAKPQAALALAVYALTGIGGCWLVEKIQRREKGI